MICPPCKKAGLLNEKANSLSDPAEVKRILRNAKAGHKKCVDYGKEYNGCTCQHRTGHYVNTSNSNVNH